jgi:hypothetical protein
LLDLLKSKLRVWFASVWKVRGGGLYAVGWAIAFLYLEVTTLLGEVAEASGVIDFITSQLIEIVFRFLGQSFINVWLAFAWPAFVIQWNPPLGLIALGIAFLLFPKFVKPYVTAWLLPDGDPEEPEAKTK